MANYLVANDLCPKTVTEEGTFRFLTGITVVTLYDTLGKDSLEYILDQTYNKTVVLSADKLKNIVELKKEGKIKGTTHIIYFDELKEADILNASSLGLTLVPYAEALRLGKEAGKQTYDEVNAETFYTFSYTSGTTGMPKGVMLTHLNFVANIGGMNKFDGEFELRDDDVYISYLPLAHVFERCLLVCAMGYKMQYGFFQGDVMKIKEDLAVLKPTIMVSVPRLYNRFYDVMQQKINELTGYKRTLTNWGIAKKMENLTTKAQTTHSVYDRLIFNKFKEVLGGRVRIMITGSAPISKEVLEFLKIAFCCQILEGYGQTECGAPASITWTRDPTSGHVGGPYRCLDIKLVDVPDMNYTSEDKDDHGNLAPRGEVCYKGYNNFKGYFRQPEQTKECIDEEGWVHTGDIGTFLPNGALKIIDRKKNIFKLAQGEYIAPDKIEQKLGQSPYIAQIFVYGDSL
jgi:long-chain acyl-CoA synthetase